MSADVAPAACSLPAATRRQDTFKRDLVEQGVAFQLDFLADDVREALLARVLEQAELEIEQGVAITSDTGTASEMGFGGTAASAPLFQSVAFLPNKGRVFLDLMREPRLLDYCTHAFRAVPYYFAQQAATIVRKGAKPQVIHSDQQAWPFPTPFPVLLTAVLCLTDFAPEMGSTQFVPGTIDGPPPAIGVDEVSGQVRNLEAILPVSASLPAGSLAMWDGRLWHGQGASHSDADRVVIIQNYAMHMVRAQDDYPAMLHDHVYAGLDEEERRLLGFEVHFEYAGRIGPRSPSDTRRNTNFAFPYVPELRRGSEARAIAANPLTVGHASEQARHLSEKTT